MFLHLGAGGTRRESSLVTMGICRRRAHQMRFTLFQRILRHWLWNREARSSRKSERPGRQCRYAEAVVAAPLKKVSKSALIWSALVVGMP